MRYLSTAAYYRRIGQEDLQASEDWLSALTIAEEFNFVDVRSLAHKKLETLDSPVDKILLGYKHGNRDSVLAGFYQICNRPESPRADEIRRLDAEDVALIMNARERLRMDENGVSRTVSEDAIERHFQSRLPISPAVNINEIPGMDLIADENSYRDECRGIPIGEYLEEPAESSESGARGSSKGKGSSKLLRNVSRLLKSRKRR